MKVAKAGLSAKEVERQVAFFEKGTQHVKLLRAATAKDGIRKLTAAEVTEAAKRYDQEAVSLIVTKFVPASGAATRMFKSVFNWIENPEKHKADINAFFKEAESFAFFEEWIQAADRLDIETFESGLESKVKWLKILVGDEGLGFANKPKGVIPFHRYAEHTATPVCEHLIEAMRYSAPSGKARVHFTVSAHHRTLFEAEVARALEQLCINPADIEVTYSEQEVSTDTVAVGTDLKPVMHRGKLLTRPGGHGALIHNLNALDADLVFIKNVDNVAHQRFMDENVRYKKALAGLLLELRADLRVLHTQMGKGLVDAASIDRVREKWRLRIPRDYANIREYLKRPIRVCGMVKNEGEPGGGPFWCKDTHTGENLQIVEQQQVNRQSMGQAMILQSATHFNPVDIVCCLRDLTGKKINLTAFVDEDQFFISEKSFEGREIKALEWPGLWNGGMAHWITVFAEMPIATFNPVKEITDLHRHGHRPL